MVCLSRTNELEKEGTNELQPSCEGMNEMRPSSMGKNERSALIPRPSPSFDFAALSILCWCTTHAKERTNELRPSHMRRNEWSALIPPLSHSSDSAALSFLCRCPTHAKERTNCGHHFSVVSVLCASSKVFMVIDSRITVPRSLRWATCGAISMSCTSALLVRLFSPECEPQNVAAYDTAS
ncbi:hypothetical protein M5K25_011138 [Dendrobium thyrsiflorum]|uniref:DUF7875 domain-containing protein n=1 Tax=Dendrobium thyrsiflorum TaxID=117978 RepID=A0ABD0V1I3_DENTH